MMCDGIDVFTMYRYLDCVNVLQTANRIPELTNSVLWLISPKKFWVLLATTSEWYMWLNNSKYSINTRWFRVLASPSVNLHQTEETGVTSSIYSRTDFTILVYKYYQIVYFWLQHIDAILHLQFDTHYKYSNIKVNQPNSITK